MLDALEENEELLSSWECDFLESVRHKIVNDRELTDGQQDKLEEIYDQRLGKL